MDRHDQPASPGEPAGDAAPARPGADAVLAAADPGAPAAATPPPAPVVATSGASVLAGGMWRTMAALLPQLYTLVISVTAARVLGPDGMGRQSFIAFAEISLVLLFTGGVSVAVTRFIGEEIGRGRPEVVRTLLRWAWRVEALAGAIAAGIMGAAAATRTELRGAWALAGIACVLGVANGVPAALLSGMQRWRQASLLALVIGPLSTLATLGVLAAGWGITGMFAVEAAAAVATLAWTGALARRAVHELIPPRHPRAAVPPRVRRYALVATLEVLLTFIVWRRSEFLFLQRFSTPTQIALYSIAFAATAALLRAFQALAGVLLPAVATLMGAGSGERIRSGFGRAVRLVLLLTIPVTAAAVALGPAGLRLVYGSRYGDAGLVLVISMLAFPLLPLFSLSFALVAGLGRQRVPVACGILAAVVDVGLDLLLIPAHGAVGAAIANSTAQVSAGVPVLVYGCRLVGAVDWQVAAQLRMAAASAAAGALAGWVAWLAGGRAAFPVGLGAGVVAFAAASRALRVLPAGDAAWLDAVAGRRLGGAVGVAARACSRR
jgi:O-antigen/teichoic acid export membrane protein